MTYFIHLDTEVTDLTALKIRVTTEGLYDQADRVYALAANMSWDGSSRDEFLNQLYQCTSKLKTLSNELHLLGFNLSRETEAWVFNSSGFSR
ncbi:MAG TPA: hypothetical protein DF984_02275 [Anaerolineaceae bacterium]|nr:hypothetical protein [Anaerolineaceae bacterium]